MDELDNEILKKFKKHNQIWANAVSEAINKQENWVSRHLALLKPEIKDNIPRGMLNKITEGQAREILAATPEEREELVKTITEEPKTPVRALHEMRSPKPKPETSEQVLKKQQRREWREHTSPAMSAAHLALFNALSRKYRTQSESKFQLKGLYPDHPETEISLDCYLLEPQIAIEIDGPKHDPDYDMRRDQLLLEQHQIDTWRFPHNFVERWLEFVLELIELRLYKKQVEVK